MELIRVSEVNGIQAVDARELHGFLNSKQAFRHWIALRIEKYGFQENIDYQRIYLTVMEDKIIPHDGQLINGQFKVEYALSLSTAKELCMVEGNEKGKEARKYFIACEQKLKELAARNILRVFEQESPLHLGL